MRKLLLLAAAVVLAALPAVPAAAAPADDATTTTPIQHVVWMMQDNHSFDNYFGTYPGADGIPRDVCLRLNLNRESTRGCVQPFRIGDTPIEDLSQGPGVQRRQENGGRMDGFVAAYRRLGLDGTSAMGYYDGADIPFHWNVADQYVLFDRFFSSTKVGSREAYLYWVAGNAPTGQTPLRSSAGYDDLPTIFDRLADQGISARFYVENLDEAATSGESRVSRSSQLVKVPLLSMKRFRDGGENAGQVVDLKQYYLDLRNGTLPAVSYIVTTRSSENPPAGPNAGSRTLRKVTTELMKSSAWSTSALMWTYDGWGGWYDHVPPPKVDSRGYGFRVPALLVSPYAKSGEVNHTVLDYTAMLHFIETNWKLAPLSSRDKQSAGLGSAFDFSAAPRPANSLPWTWPAPEVEAATNSPAPVIYSVYGLAAAIAIAIVSMAARRGPLAAPVTRAALLLRSRFESLPDRMKRFSPVNRSMPGTASTTESVPAGDASTASPIVAARLAPTPLPRTADTESSGEEVTAAKAGIKSAREAVPAASADAQSSSGATAADADVASGRQAVSAASADVASGRKAVSAASADAESSSEATVAEDDVESGRQAVSTASADAESSSDAATAEADVESVPEAPPEIIAVATVESVSEAGRVIPTEADADGESVPEAGPVAADVDVDAEPGPEAVPETAAQADAEWPLASWIGSVDRRSAIEAGPGTAADADVESADRAGRVIAADVDVEFVPEAVPVAADVDMESGPEAGPAAADADVESGPEAAAMTSPEADGEWPVAWWIQAAHRPSETAADPTTTAEAEAESPTETEPATTAEAEDSTTDGPAAGTAALADDKRTRHQRHRNQSRTQRRKASRR
jgi:phospholipase C